MMKFFKRANKKKAQEKPVSKPKKRFRNKRMLLLVVCVLLYFVGVLGFVSNKSGKQRCSHINIEIADNTSQLFITPKDIIKLLKDKQFNVLGYPINKINDLQIEDSLRLHSSVENVEVYKSSKGRLNILIEQRQPIVRILDATGDGYYIDKNGELMPLSLNYTARVPVITGQFRRSYQDYCDYNLTIDKKDTLLSNLFSLAMEIYQNPYWSAQCDQIVVDQKGDIILIPKTGADKIILSTDRDFSRDFNILTAFYKQALPKEGWDKYKTINLKYNHQIVCVK